MRRISLGIAVFVVCVGLAGSALGQDEPISRTLTPTGSGEDRRAVVVVPVRNAGDDEEQVRIRLVTDRSGFVVTERQESPSGVAVNAVPARVPGGETTPVRIRIALPGKSPANGTMIVSAGPGLPTVVDFATAPAEAPAAVSAQPESVSLLTTTKCPWETLCEQRRDALLWLTPEQAKVTERQRLAVSGDGDEVVLFLSETSGGQRTPTPPKGSSQARIRVAADAVPPAGTYTATFPFPGSGSDTAVKATLHVQHWIGWALLAVLIGALAGKFLTGPAVEQWRKRQELRITLTQDNATYLQLRNEAPAGGLYHLYSHFGALDEREPHLPPDDVDPNRRLGIERLYGDLMAARSDAQLTALEGRVNGLHADLSTWAEVARRLMSFESLDGVPDAYGAGKEVRELIDGPPVSLGTAEEITAHALALERLADLVKEYRELLAAWDDAGAGNRPPAADPQSVYVPAKGPLERDAAEHRALMAKVAAAKKSLAAEPTPAADIGGAEAAVAGGPEPTVDRPGPLRRAVRRVDWVLWTVTLVIAVVAFTLTIYVGKDFGGVSDYAAAFVAGFTGAAVANVGLVPLVRALGASAV